MNAEATEFFPAVEMDASKSPGLVFFQDKETRYTVVCDATTGAIVGAAPYKRFVREHPGRERVMCEVRRYQQRR